MASSGSSMSSSTGSSPSAQATSGSSLSSPSSPTSSPVSSADHPSTSPPASSSPSQSSTGNASTSASPVTSTPTTTPQSSAAQTSSAVARTTSSSQAASVSTAAGASTSPTTQAVTSTSSFTSQVATVYSTTDPAGSVVYVTSTVPEVFTTSVSSSPSSGGSSNTGVIVGAVVGGVVGVALLALLLFCIRKRVRDDEFDGNFDPDRVVGHTDVRGGTLPHVDLAEEVTPFPQNQTYTDQGSASMRQYGKSPYIPVPTSLGQSGHGSTDFYPPGAAGAGSSNMDAQPRKFMQPGAGPPPPGAYVPPINMYGTGPVDWHAPRPGVSPPPSTVSNGTTSTRAAKEREAMGRNGQGAGLTLATQHEVAEGSGDVVVHQDAGRAPIEEHVPPREIPPAYESIHRD